MMSVTYSQVIKYSLAILVVLSLGVVLFLVYVNKESDKMQQAGDRPDIEQIRSELSKPPDISPEDSVQNPDGTIELSEEMKAKIRRELQGNR